MLNVNRLTTVTGPANKSYQYAPNGNITHKSDAGTYSYPTNSIRPHAVASISGTINTNFTYDANGNLLTGNGRTLTYTAFNKPGTITGPSGTTTLTYDANFNRVLKTAPGGTTTYLGKHYEKVVSGATTTQKRYLYAGTNLVGVYATVSNGTANTRYVHTDHIGSVAVITNETGGVVQRLSYDAFGKRRNTNGTDATSITAQTTRGFTRHEHDDEVGLINMNAREYDSLLGRFIQPDTIVPGATSSQAYNRYSYTNNNPLSRIDPTGNWSLKKAIKNIVRAHKSVLQAMHSRPALTITAAYATGGALSSYFSSATAPTAFAAATGANGAMQLTALGQITVGAAAGGVGGWGTTGDSRGFFTGAALGGVGGYLSNGTAYANQVTQASNLINNVATGQFGAAAATLGNTAMNYGFSLVEASIARHYGVSPEAFNIGLMGLSIVGNQFVGTRFTPDNERFSDTGNRGFVGVANRGAKGWLFDAVDIMLGYQGMPTASMRDYLVTYAGLSVSGHSLGTMDQLYTTANGLSPGGSVYAMPFGNIAPPGVKVNLGYWDGISGGPLGWLFSPGAHGCSVGFGGHSLDAYAAGC